MPIATATSLQFESASANIVRSSDIHVGNRFGAVENLCTLLLICNASAVLRCVCMREREGIRNLHMHHVCISVRKQRKPPGLHGSLSLVLYGHFEFTPKCVSVAIKGYHYKYKVFSTHKR